MLRPAADDAAAAREQRIGVAAGIAAYVFWGFVAPIYFKSIAKVAPLEVLAHRVIWSVAFLALLLIVQRRLPAVLSAVRDPRILRALAASTILVALNWLIFIWAVGKGHILQASLGYFITPLLNVLLGYVFLGERLHSLQKLCVLFAALGIAWLLYSTGGLPLPALAMAITFALYGLVRKVVRVDALVGLSVETGMLLVPALGYLLYLASRHESVFAAGPWSMRFQLISAGIVTSAPLLFFTHAARRLRLATLGFLQYLSPTGQFLLAVLVYKEKFDVNRAICFAFIWLALVVYSYDAVQAARRQRNAAT
jgi:chloramphenicol-sensitive protein RarD